MVNLSQLKEKLKKKLIKWGSIGGGIAFLGVSIMGIIIGPFLGMNASAAANNGMQSASDSSWEQFLRYVATKEGGKRVDANGNENSNGEYYIVDDDSKGNPTVGHGLCLKSYADDPNGAYLHVEEFAANNIDSKKLAEDYEAGGIALVKVEIADQIWRDHLKSAYDAIVSTYSHLNLKEYQYFALTDVKYRRGNTKGFEEQYNSKWTSREDQYKQDVSGESFSTDSLYGFFNNNFKDTESGVYTRKQDQWLLFKYGYYRPLQEYWIEGTASADISSLQEDDYKGTYKSSINGYTFVEYYQMGPSWKNDSLNGASGSTVGTAGCHVTSMAMALTALSGETITPKQVNNAFNFMDNDDTAILNTSEFSYLQSSISIGPAQTSGLNRDLLVSNLQAKNIIMLKFKAPCEWTSSTHYVICADYKMENNQEYIYIVNSSKSNNVSGWIPISRITIAQWKVARVISKK